MKKRILFLAVIVTLLTVATLCMACSKNPEGSQLAEFQGITFNSVTVNYDGKSHEITADGVPENANVSYSGNVGTEVGEYNATAVVTADGYKEATYTAKLKIDPPTAETVVGARAAANAVRKENYDFRLHLQGSVNIGGFNGTANGYYDGQYRFNKDTSELSFSRTTSGSLLYDSVEYIKTEGDSRIKMKTNPDGDVKSISIIPKEEEGLVMLNLPFVKIVDALKDSDFSEITVSDNTNFKFKAKLNFADSTETDGLLGVLGNSGSKIAIGSVAFTNPFGLDFYFNLDEKMVLNEFAFGAEIRIPVKGVPVGFSIKYTQQDGDSTINMPSTAGLFVTESDISRELGVINSAFSAVTDSKTYSLEVAAKNEFDPGWNVTATVDKYKGTIFKNTYDLDGSPFVAFNHSFECKTHLDDESKETYKYTYGNIQDGTVHKISRTGTNKQETADGVTIDTQTNLFVKNFLFLSSDVNCIRRSSKNGSTIYEIHVKDSKTISANETVAELVNSNDEADAKKVDNYFNKNAYEINDSCVTIEMKNGSIVSAAIETEIRYTPTTTDYSDQIITLTDTINMTVNEKKDKAAEYKAPKNVETKLGSYGLNNAKFYIN